MVLEDGLATSLDDLLIHHRGALRASELADALAVGQQFAGMYLVTGSTGTCSLGPFTGT